MIVNLVERYDKLVQAWSVREFDQVATYPHHKHIMKGNEIAVRESHGGDLEQIFEEIEKKMHGPK